MVTSSEQLRDDIQIWLASKGLGLSAALQLALLNDDDGVDSFIDHLLPFLNPSERVRIISSLREGVITGHGSVFDPATNSQKLLILFHGDDGGIEYINDLSAVQEI